MEIAMANAKELCPQVDTKAVIMAVFNDTPYPNPTIDLPRMICRTATFNNFYAATFPVVTYWTWLIGILLGFPSCILALVIFCRKEFSSTSFMYHRVINIIQLVYTIEMTVSFVKMYVGEAAVRRSFFLTCFATYFFGKLEAAIPHAVEIIIVWVAVERALLCNSPRGFNRVDKKPLAILIMILAVVVAIFIYLPTAFTNTYQYNNVTGDYDRPNTPFKATPIYAMYLKAMTFTCVFEVCFLGPASIITVFGLIQISKRKHKLISSAGFHSVGSKMLLQQIAINRQLCLLQICEAVPVLINAVLMTFIVFAPYEFDVKKLALMPLEQAVYKEFLFEVVDYASETLNAFHIIAHCTHFYRYLLFSTKVRKAFFRMVNKNKVSDTTGTS